MQIHALLPLQIPFESPSMKHSFTFRITVTPKSSTIFRSKNEDISMLNRRIVKDINNVLVAKNLGLTKVKVIQVNFTVTYK